MDWFQISFFFKKKALYELNTKVCSLVSIHFDSSHLTYNKKNFRLLIQRYARFWFFWKGSRNSFSTTFCVWFFKIKIYQLTNFYSLIAFIFVILANVCIAIATFQYRDVISFEINFVFLIKPFFYMTKYSR